jgi:[acyl-carrier-protein] S-malonyltransferase
MSDLAFLFPGQGSQFAGMGKLLFDRFQSARLTFQEADDTLGLNLSELCFNGPDENLKKTENTQPALLTVSTAAARVLTEQGISPSLVAGHSLGEYSALVAAKTLEFKDALRLVRMRGQFMQEAVPQGVGSMAAILNLPSGKLEAVLAEASQGEVVSAANFNSPDQTVIAGHTGAVTRAMAHAKAAGARRAIALAVSAPFHCSLMRPAQEKLKPYLHETHFGDLPIPLVNNWQAQIITNGEEARQGLIEQIPNAVQWVDSVRQLKHHGITRFIEVGPGTVLTGLCRGIEPDLKGAKFCAPADLEAIKSLLAS